MLTVAKLDLVAVLPMEYKNTLSNVISDNEAF